MRERARDTIRGMVAKGYKIDVDITQGNARAVAMHKPKTSKILLMEIDTQADTFTYKVNRLTYPTECRRGPHIARARRGRTEPSQGQGVRSYTRSNGRI